LHHQGGGGEGMSKYIFTEGEIIPSDIMSQGGLRITPLPTEPGEPQRYLAERISLPEPSIYLHNNVPAPTCEGWWWVWTGQHWEPCLIVVVNGEPTIYCWGEDIENISALYLEDFDDHCYFTGPIPEPPMKGDDVL